MHTLPQPKLAYMSHNTRYTFKNLYKVHTVYTSTIFTRTSLINIHRYR